MDWFFGVAGAILSWIFAVVGAIWDWLFERGIQEPMSVLQGVGAIATAFVAWRAYRQYKDKRYGLSDGEWDLLKALCQYRVGFFPWFNNWPNYMIDKLEVYLESDLQSDTFRNVLERYPPDLRHALLNMTVITYTTIVQPNPMNRLRKTPRIDLLLTAREEDKDGEPLSPGKRRVRIGKLLVSARYRKYCRSLENREYLSRVTTTKSVEKYELTGDGEHFVQKQLKRIAKREYRCNFVDEVKMAEAYNRSWHELEPGSVVPEFLECRAEICDGVEFPDYVHEEYNPCGVGLLISASKDQVDVEKIKSMLGHLVHLEVKNQTVHLASSRGGRNALARLVYFRVREVKPVYDERGTLILEGDVKVDMWFGSPAYSGVPRADIADSQRYRLPESDLEQEKKEIEEHHYPKESVKLPKSIIKETMDDYYKHLEQLMLPTELASPYSISRFRELFRGRGGAGSLCCWRWCPAL